ncbi:hypothetical protein Glove_493g35 [Diversispora epigaea]|uniref:Uncharacterized protein n=1 Tax=Diversispora epigaea TaxID=1348612 RepID=A0A397GRL1_9GLOM|nr:hypothetical protein Glove_493g35 [Diversispora epigaea]
MAIVPSASYNFRFDLVTWNYKGTISSLSHNNAFYHISPYILSFILPRWACLINQICSTYLALNKILTRCIINVITFYGLQVIEMDDHSRKKKDHSEGASHNFKT